MGRRRSSGARAGAGRRIDHRQGDPRRHALAQHRPLRGGRSIAVSGVKGRPKEGYFGAVGGGLWKTIDGGLSWTPVTDGQITASSVGAVAVSESNPDIVFIGTGESCIRGNIMPGDGVYKSTEEVVIWPSVTGVHDR